MSDTALTRSRPTDRPAGAGVADPIARLRPVLAGAIGALAGIGLSELVAGFLGAPSLLAAIGGFVIDNQPPGAKDLVVSLFGTNDKLALEALIVIVAAVVGGLLGVVAVRRSYALAVAGFAAFAIAGFLATLRMPAASSTTSMIVALVAGIAGVQVMSFLLNTAGAGQDRARDARRGVMPDWSRRGFLIRAGGVAIASTAAGLIGRRLLEGPSAATGGTPAAALPRPVETATLPAGAELQQAGLTPLVVPNDDFYRIDTALVTPSVDVDELAAARPRHGRPRGVAVLRRSRRAAAHRAVRDDLVRQQRGRRQPRRQRQVDRCPAPRRPGDGRRPGRRDASWSVDRSTAGRPACPRPGSWTNRASR